MSLRLAEQTHESDIDVAVAENLGDVSDHAGLILLDHDNCTVVAGEVYRYAVDARDAHLAAAK